MRNIHPLNRQSLTSLFFVLVLLLGALLALPAAAWAQPPPEAEVGRNDAATDGNIVFGDEPLPRDTIARLPVELETGDPDRLLGFMVPSITHTSDSYRVRRGEPQDFNADPNSREHFSYSWHIEGGDHQILGSSTMQRFTFVPEDRARYTVVLRTGRRDRPDHDVEQQEYQLTVSRPTRGENLKRSALWGAIGVGIGALIGTLSDNCSDVDVAQGQACGEAWTGAAIGGGLGLGIPFVAYEW